MYEALHRIAREYRTSRQLRHAALKVYGLPFEEVLEMAYENAKEEARAAIKGIRVPKQEEKQR